MTQHDTPAPPGRPARRALLSSFAGTTMEWYDFFIYGTAAALVFGEVFFPAADPATGTLLALSTFSIAFVARPLGAVVFGHFGDRVGRKSTLVATIGLMGVATLLIGFVPSYDTIGIAAPLALVALRLVQGIALGGEYSGAVLIGVEHARRGRRGLYGALINSGAWWGMGLGTLVFMLVAMLPDESFLAWGWRVPFVVGGVLLFIALYIRVGVEESPEFEAARKRSEPARAPVVEVLRRYPFRLVMLVLSYVSAGAIFYTLNVYSLSYSQAALDIPRAESLRYLLAATLLTIVAVPLFGWLSDRVSRKLVFVVSIPAMAVGVVVWFALLDSGSGPLILLGYLIVSIPVAAYYGTMAAFFAKIFPADVRFSGLAVGYTVGAVLGSAAAPVVSTYLLQATGGWGAIALYLGVLSAVSLVAALFLRELPDDEPTGVAPARDELTAERAS